MIALYIIGGIVLLLLILVIAAPTDFRLDRQIVINKPKNEVFPYLKSLKNQDHWSIFNLRDPNMKRNFTGTDGNIGFIAAWDSEDKNVGKGEQEIIKITEGSRVDMALRFEKPMKSTSDAWLIAEDNGNKTTVHWGFGGKSKRPMNVMSMMMKGMMTKIFDQSLANLKKELEK
ncbi:MAG: SRPBCC family protein [Bacteroidia bacterium]